MTRRFFKSVAALLLPALLSLSGCSKHSGSETKPPIGVTTSWLECAVKDVAGGRFETVRLSPPGDCPGHFDLSPGTVRLLSRCSLLFRFDFQKALDRKLSGLTTRGLRIVSVAMPGGLCVPERYLDACRQVQAALERRNPGCAEELRSRLTSVEKRLADLSAVVRRKIADAGLRGEKVVCSEHQSSFCRWLGLEVVAEFSRAENMTSSAVKQVIAAGERSGARIVIANLQEGRQAADSIAKRLHAAVIVFSNFPSMDSEQQRFDDLVLGNLESLVRGAKR